MDPQVKIQILEMIDKFHETAVVVMSEYHEALIGLANCALEQHRAEVALQKKRDHILAAAADDPKRMGANEAVREATLRLATEAEQTAVDAAKESMIFGRSDAENHRLSWEFIKASHRLQEAKLALYGDTPLRGEVPLRGAEGGPDAE